MARGSNTADSILYGDFTSRVKEPSPYSHWTVNHSRITNCTKAMREEFADQGFFQGEVCGSITDVYSGNSFWAAKIDRLPEEWIEGCNHDNGTTSTERLLQYLRSQKDLNSTLQNASPSRAEPELVEAVESVVTETGKWYSFQSGDFNETLLYMDDQLQLLGHVPTV